MSLVVVDTNILVSALWSREGTPSKIVKMILEKQLTPCHDYRIMSEYKQVMFRPRFHFNPADVGDLLGLFQKNGISVIAEPTDVCFADETDRKFYEVAKACNAVLITGNKKHYPNEPFIKTAAQFLAAHDSGL
jgi:putative PIN family toxin of toxin-antitoxin system